MNRRILFVMTVVGALAPHMVAAQTVAPLLRVDAEEIRVALAVTDPTTGLIESAFASALRSIGDVRIVTPSEEADLKIRVVAVCNGVGSSCDDAVSYGLAVELVEPINTVVVAVAAYTADSTAAWSRPLLRRMAEQLHDFEVSHELWAASYGRDVYRERVADLIATIDARCLRKLRLVRRAAAAYRVADNETVETLREQVRAGSWYC